jgi:hypothetical protein
MPKEKTVAESTQSFLGFLHNLILFTGLSMQNKIKKANKTILL